MSRLMLPGRPASNLVKPLYVVSRLSFIFVVLVIASIAIGLPGTKAGVGLIIAFAAIGIPGAVATAVCNTILGYKASTEVRFGYTTLQDRYREVEELDPRTGRTIRGAGEHYLDRQTRSDRLSSGFDLSADSTEPATPGELYKRRLNRSDLILVCIGIAASALALLARFGVIPY